MGVLDTLLLEERVGLQLHLEGDEVLQDIRVLPAGTAPGLHGLKTKCLKVRKTKPCT